MQELGVIAVSTLQFVTLKDGYLYVRPFADLDASVRLNIVDFLCYASTSGKTIVEVYRSEDGETFFGYQNGGVVGSIKNRPFKLDFEKANIPAKVAVDCIVETFKSLTPKVTLEKEIQKQTFEGTTLEIDPLGNVLVSKSVEGFDLSVAVNSLQYFTSLRNSLLSESGKVRFPCTIKLNDMRFMVNAESSIEKGILDVVIHGVAIPNEESMLEYDENTKEQVNKFSEAFKAKFGDKKDNLITTQFNLSEFGFTSDAISAGVLKTLFAIKRLKEQKVA